MTHLRVPHVAVSFGETCIRTRQGQLAPRARKSGIERHGLLEPRNPTPDVGRRIRGDNGSCGQIGVICFDVARAAPRDIVLSFSQRHGEDSRHGFRDLVLNGEDIAEFLVIGVGPDARAVRVHELCGDAQLIPLLPHAALEQMLDAEGFADRAQILIPALERETRRSGR
jgi:hypothetical protein